MTVGQVIALTLGGFLLRCAVDVVAEIRANRRRRFDIERDYPFPCTDCKMKSMSRIGMRERTSGAVSRASERLHRIASRG